MQTMNLYEDQTIRHVEMDRIPGPPNIVFFFTTSSRFHKELGIVYPNLGLTLRSACYSAGLGRVLSHKINPKLGRVL